MSNEFVPIPMVEPLVVDLNNEVLQEADERAARSCLVRIFWDFPTPLPAVQRTMDDVWKCRGGLRIYEAGFGLHQFIFPTVQKRNWVLKTQPWSFELSIMNMMRFATPSEILFNQLQFMEIAVKLAGVPIDCRTLAFGRQMLSQIGVVRKVNFFIADSAEGFFIKGLVKLDLLGPRAGRVTARFPEGRTFFVYFQYIQVVAICYKCGIIGHIYMQCPHQHLILDLEERNRWICIPDCGKLVEGPNLERKSKPKYQSRRGVPLLPPSVTASFEAVRLNKQQIGQDMNSIQASKKDDQPRLIYAEEALELENGPLIEGGFNELLGQEKDVVQKAKETVTPETGKRENLLKRKKDAEEKGKNKATELENAPKKTVQRNKGIIIREMEENDTDMLMVTNQEDAISIRSAKVAGLESELDGAEAEGQLLGQKEREVTKTNLMENLFGVQGADTRVNWNDLEPGEEETPFWVNTINTYGSNEGTIGDILREDEDLEEDDGGIKN